MKVTKQEARMGVLFIVPTLILFILFTAYPLINTLIMAFFDWDGFSEQRTFVGLANFTKVFNDGVFWLGMKNVLIFALAAFVLMNPIALILAVLVSSDIAGSKYYKIIYYLPVMISGIVVGFIWSWLFNGEFGLINNFLDFIGLSGLKQDWLNTANTAIFAVVIASIWQGIGGSFLLFWAGLSTIPKDFYESADLDGANFFEKLFYITIPSIKSVMTIVVILTAIGAVNTYQIVISLTKGGPAGATTVPILYIFDMSQKYGNFGYATAMSVVLGVVLFIFSMLRLFLTRKKGD